ncbi:MAG: ribosomal RNA small subunit methyltransferase A [Candidatus Nealsonbacteria bacterium]|nr:ribosomal RNA small subunit methyltransferase A [Candidatus Nealsonbacteria bacterium]
MSKIHPIKRLGQNFLIDKNIVKKVIKTANLKKKDVVLEIGPGLGALTKKMSKLAKKVIAVEKDPRMYKILKENLRGFRNLKIINEDILKPTENCSRQYCREQFSVVANLPFYITAPVIRRFLESENPPKEMILVVQKEVAQRICSNPPKTNLLAVSVQFYAKPEIISYIPRKSFWPSPKVDSAIIKIVPRQFRVPVSRQFRERFFRIVKAGFTHPRKQLANNLAEMLKLDKRKVNSLLIKNNIQPTQRAETLTTDDWLRLTKVL